MSTSSILLPTSLPPSVLRQRESERQEFSTSWVPFQEGHQRYRIRALVRYDDRHHNGHNTLSITGETQRAEFGIWKEDSGGCIHDEIAKHFPHLIPAIPFHLCSSDGPMHYLENTLYHAREHGPTSAWIEYSDPTDPLGLIDSRPRTAYVKRDKALLAEQTPGYTVKWDEKTAKVRNLDHARSSACWPEATDAELCQEPEALRLALIARLPALMERFKAVVESLGFQY